MRGLAVAAILTVVLVGCASWPSSVAETAQEVKTHAPTSAPATRPAAEGEVMAYVEGVPIYMDRMHDLLVRSGGLEIAELLIANELVRQAAEKRNITVTEDEIQAEHDRTLVELFRNVEEPPQRERLLKGFINRKKLSPKQWRMTMRRNSLLRKLVEDKVEVSQEEILDEFGNRYGKKVQVRHIQTASLSDAEEILTELKAGDADFAALARKRSKAPSAQGGGALPTIGAKTQGVPAAICQAALAMKEVGEISDPVQVETDFHILKLERVLQPKDVKFEDVRDTISLRLRENKIRAEQMRTLREMFSSADVDLVNPIIDQEADERAKQ